MIGNVPIHPDDEARVAMEMTRDLEGMAAEKGISPSAWFADQVMAAVALEPLPQPARAFKAALLSGRMRAAIASLGDARRVAGGGSAPVFVRAQALALVLVLTIGSLALAGGATVGAVGFLNARSAGRTEPDDAGRERAARQPVPHLDTRGVTGCFPRGIVDAGGDRDTAADTDPDTNPNRASAYPDAAPDGDRRPRWWIRRRRGWWRRWNADADADRERRSRRHGRRLTPRAEFARVIPRGSGRELSANSRARLRTETSIGIVSRPVNVFCWLGWYEPTTV